MPKLPPTQTKKPPKLSRVVGGKPAPLTAVSLADELEKVRVNLVRQVEILHLLTSELYNRANNEDDIPF